MITETVFAGGLVVAGLGGYAVFYEPLRKPRVTEYRVRSDRFTFFRQRNKRGLRIAVLSDLHACRFWMDAPRIKGIVAQTNALEPDLVLLLGDYVSAIWPKLKSNIPLETWSTAVAKLTAPMGRFAVLGNHDCRFGAQRITKALEDAGVPVLHNTAIQLRTPAGARFWIGGLGDQKAHRVSRGRYQGADDFDGTASQVRGDTDPFILMAHEPEIFQSTSGRVDLLLSGHTHGGQVRLPGIGSLYTPSHMPKSHVYGHVFDGNRQMIVSGGLGCSRLPLRFLMPPEIVMIETI
ncbi:MAG: metallophosphoesterase [Pseudomonadota bacterium]